jgi:ubiquinone/menaquinone biosynthesis C-methylase UbiE
MLHMILDFIPQGASVFEAAAGTGAISLAVADKAGSVLCTDLSERMLGVARRKAERHGVGQVNFYLPLLTIVSKIATSGV